MPSSANRVSIASTDERYRFRFAPIRRHEHGRKGRTMDIRGLLGVVSRRVAHRIPFIVQLSHAGLLAYPNKCAQVMFGSVDQAFELGAAGVGATIYCGSDEATRQIQEVSAAFARAHELGLFTV